ncbi:OmpA family protein [Pseudothauera nasutitermitis]|uniref:OmpA family protein n=2 Tax=Pseudothauera nasutitermitis TaxID=2565930 RepID=A0A4S4ATQ7_9RHOO|nr:OmpA family protein [Pseudothauera nasutitermitis]
MNLKRSVAATLAALGALAAAHAAAQEEHPGKRIDNARSESRAVPAPGEWQPVIAYELPSSVSRADAQAMLAAQAPAEPPQMAETLSESGIGALFESGQADLLPAARSALDALAARVQDKQALRMRVVGHADTQRPSARTRARFGNNQGLSEARALVVAQYLRERIGLPADAVEVRGYGDERPVASNDNEEGMAQNRRVEIAVWHTPLAAPAPRVPGPCEADGQTDLPFRVTVDGQPLAAGEDINEADRQRCVDVALAGADIQVKYDSLAANPALNVWPTTEVALQGETVRFAGWTNYAAWIRKAEVRVFRHDERPTATPLAVLPLAWGETAEWLVPTGSTDGYRYLLRVYDEQGRYDETAEKYLEVVARRRPHDDLDSEAREALVGWGENALSLRNIPVRGGTITVSGRDVAPGSTVRTLGMTVPLGDNGRFVERQILPAGPHGVEVQVSGPDGDVASFRRNVSIPTDDWFYIAIADLTVGRNVVNHRDRAELVTGDDRTYRNETYIDGRGAFYLKGKIKGEWLLTAAADTREQPFEHLFTNFTSKDPRYLLRNIDPDAYYPVYGDDSTTVDDAPTQGKFYVRLERGDSHVMWGNFQTAWTGSELVQYSRGLYGARGRYVSEAATGFGERRTRAELFAADPGTLGARQEFRGTGGSLYYLRNQDITQGSERIWVEVRDRDSGLVIERRQLTPALDYDINYLQGRIMLREPLSSTGSASGLVHTSAISGNPLYLVTTYEYVPGMEKVDNLTTGLRATHWINDWFRLGFTGFRQGEGDTRQTLSGVDVLLRAGQGSSLAVELARSTGAGSQTLLSSDGGFGFESLTSSGGQADARRVEGHLDLADFSDSARGRVAAYWQKKDSGFSGPGQIGLGAGGEGITQSGASARIDVGESGELSVKADHSKSDVQLRSTAEVGYRHQLNEEWAVAGAVRHDERDLRTQGVIVSSELSEEGERTDVAVRVEYQPLKEDGEAGEREDWEVYGFVQGTVAKSGERRDNNRAGLGGRWQATDRIGLRAEASGGNGGTGGLLGADYRISDRSNAYMNYVLETEGTDYGWRGRTGSLVTGADYRVSEQVRVYGENRVAHGAGPQGLTQAFGVDLAPNDRWTYGLKLEFGRISEPLSSDVRRRALGLSMAYKDAQTKYAGSLEYREDNNSSGTGRTWLMRNTLGHQLDPAWRLIGKANVSRSSGTRGMFWDGDFHEIVLGAAYRPVDNDRWNTLFKYTNFHNVPSSGQLSASGRDADYSQRSQVFAIDTIWDAQPWLSLGVKYGLRIGDIKFTNPDSEWFRSRADLLVLRADWHFVREWDAVVEWRNLRAKEAEDARAGALVAIYRHVGQHVKMGVGYNFTTYSDDLTDLSYRSRGWFFNVLATF